MHPTTCNPLPPNRPPRIARLLTACFFLSTPLPPATAETQPPPGFVLVPAGQFAMGDPLDGIPNAPIRQITLSPFYIQETPVTQQEWNDVRTWGLSHGYSDLSLGDSAKENHPIVSISWLDTIK